MGSRKTLFTVIFKRIFTKYQQTDEKPNSNVAGHFLHLWKTIRILVPTPKKECSFLTKFHTLRMNQSEKLIQIPNTRLKHPCVITRPGTKEPPAQWTPRAYTYIKNSNNSSQPKWVEFPDVTGISAALGGNFFFPQSLRRIRERLVAEMKFRLALCWTKI